MSVCVPFSVCAFNWTQWLKLFACHLHTLIRIKRILSPFFFLHIYRIIHLHFFQFHSFSVLHMHYVFREIYVLFVERIRIKSNISRNYSVFPMEIILKPSHPQQGYRVNCDWHVISWRKNFTIFSSYLHCCNAKSMQFRFFSVLFSLVVFDCCILCRTIMMAVSVYVSMDVRLKQLNGIVNIHRDRKITIRNTTLIWYESDKALKIHSTAWRFTVEYTSTVSH